MSKQEFSSKDFKPGDLITWNDRYDNGIISTWRVIKKLDHTILVIEKLGEESSGMKMIDVSDVEAIISK